MLVLPAFLEVFQSRSSQVRSLELSAFLEVQCPTNLRSPGSLQPRYIDQGNRTNSQEMDIWIKERIGGMMSKPLMVGFLGLLIWVPGSVVAQQADVIYQGGDIVTVDDQNPTAEALAVKAGKILAVGKKKDVLEFQGPNTELIDLQGKTLAPGFVDGHAHFNGFGAQAVGANLLAPPDGDVNTIDDVVNKLKEFAAGPDARLTGWIFGLGYDDSLLGRHPTRDDLDQVSKEFPVMAVHISGHFCAVNSVGLELIGYTDKSPNPEGGVIRRKEGTQEPNGVLEELAGIPHMLKVITPITPETQAYFMKRGLELAKSFGYTTGHEGRAFANVHEAMVNFANHGGYDIDVLTYVDYVDKKLLESDWYSREYKNRYRIAGVKITLDGSPQGWTAWRTKPYLLPPDGQQPGYKGYPAIPRSQTVTELFDEAYQKGWQVLAHANGDAAVDQLLQAIRNVDGKYPEKDRRHTLIHGQFVRQDQLDSCKEPGVMPSLFPMHTFYWGDWYDQIIGPELAAQISPMKSVLDRGMVATSHTDAPVALPNLMQVMWATVNRVTRTGKVQGPNERVAPLEALKMITLWGASQHFEEDRKGSLEVGKLADMVILSANPLKVDPMEINKIVVLETIKEGNRVYERDN